jgi:hypothetical protein
MMSKLLKLLAIVWASPWSLLGLLLGAVGLISGGKAYLVHGAVEFCGGGVRWLLRRTPLVRGAAALTLGHVILAQTPFDLESCRSHEHIHIRQYERWGPAFLPAYLSCSLWLWLRGRNGYLDNPFEVQAYREAG